MDDSASDPSAFIEQGLNAIKLADTLAASVRAQQALSGLLSDVGGRMTELSRFLQDFEFITKAGREDWAFYMEEPFNPHTIKLHASPLDASSTWKEKFYPWIKSATFTSATLSVQGDLTYFVQKMGMDAPGGKKSPFLRVYNESAKSDENRSVIVAKFLPKPSAPEYNDAVNDTLAHILPEVEENTMVLFTSVSAMMKAQAALAPLFAEKGKLLLCQHVDGALDGLVAMFRKSRGACLLGCQQTFYIAINKDTTQVQVKQMDPVRFAVEKPAPWGTDISVNFLMGYMDTTLAAADSNGKRDTVVELKYQ